MPTILIDRADFLLQQLDAAVAEVFSLMLGHICSPTPTCLIPHPGFIASIAFSGTLTGICALHLGLASAGELASDLTGEPPPPDSALPADTVGELCNMIAGSWKSRLPPPYAACHLSTPTVIPAPLPQQTATRAYRFATHCLTLELTLATQ